MVKGKDNNWATSNKKVPLNIFILFILCMRKVSANDSVSEGPDHTAHAQSISLILLTDSEGHPRSLIRAFVVRICPKVRFRMAGPIYCCHLCQDQG